ncbi:D-alanyl-D-alanine carboxypeptidase [Streptomyces griseosporeus]|uniref:D-alanyl-D-alanine carboxypeptidase n=1 Tax=Streptomyces griseosporeus TaxID=1910 RepID=UPI0036FEE37A
MEEASVAGESPDRSKQRESSAEPTSGSAVPVPEARDGERGDSGDPRLTLSREEAATGSPRGGVDTATRVLSIPERTERTAKAGAGDSGHAGDAGDAGDADEDAGVDSEDSEAEAGADSASASGADGARDGSGDGDPADGDSGNAERDERLRAAVAKWVTSTPEGKGEKGTEEAESAGDAETAQGAESAESAGDAETAEDDETADDAEGRSGASGAQGSRGDDHEAEEKTAGAPVAAEDGQGDQDDQDADEDSEARAEADGKAEGKDTDSPAPEAAPEAADADGEGRPQGPPAADDETRTGGAGGDDTAEGEAEAEAPGKPAVDQPTTMLKLGPPTKPAKPAVDQPTTMLKVGKPDKPDKQDKPATPERDSERTSKFVALKPLDEPATRKPPQSPQSLPSPQTPKTPSPADATAALPQVGPERTTQQPLPPKPPLDLLAELTNTPPPPQTPLRTLARRVKIWTPLVLLLAIVFAVVQAVRPLPAPALVLTGQETYTFDGGKVSLPWSDKGQGWLDVDGVGKMDGFGEQKPVPIGSVAKTMTAYLILRDHPLKVGQEGPKIEIDALAEKEGGYSDDGESTLNTVKAGQSLTEKQALSAIMIPSANNIARLLARWDAGSEAAFVKKMNDAAKELGLTHTTYTDPSGLKETTVSTAQDQVKLGREVVKIPALVDITSKASWTDPSGKYHDNYNQLPFRMGAIGIKTGSTTAAGGNLLFASRKEVGGRTVTLVGAVLGQTKPSILATANRVSEAALRAAQDALTSAKIVKKGDVVGYVDDQLGGRTPVVVTEDVTAVGWSGLKVRLSFAAGEVPHAAPAGTKVGTLTVGDGTSGAVKVPVALQKDLVEPGYPQKLTRIA